jgi:hypothetical protein
MASKSYNGYFSKFSGVYAYLKETSEWICGTE